MQTGNGSHKPTNVSSKIIKEQEMAKLYRIFFLFSNFFLVFIKAEPLPYISLSKIKKESPSVSLFRSLNPLYRYIHIWNIGTFCDKIHISWERNVWKIIQWNYTNPKVQLYIVRFIQWMSEYNGCLMAMKDPDPTYEISYNEMQQKLVSDAQSRM